jgi:hypothetical protein
MSMRLEYQTFGFEFESRPNSIRQLAAFLLSLHLFDWSDFIGCISEGPNPEGEPNAHNVDLDNLSGSNTLNDILEI